MNEKEIDDFTNKVTTLMTLFTSVYHTRHVTPYKHVLSAHIPSLLRDTGSLTKFSQQGLEKLNDDLTKDYFKSTNHRNEEALKTNYVKVKPSRSSCCIAMVYTLYTRIEKSSLPYKLNFMKLSTYPLGLTQLRFIHLKCV